MSSRMQCHRRYTGGLSRWNVSQNIEWKPKEMFREIVFSDYIFVLFAFLQIMLAGSIF